MTLVAVDIGGTNVRFAIVQDDGALTAHRSMLCGDFPSFEAAIQSYAALQEIAITAASVAVAGPVQGDLVEVTNNHWSFSKSGLVTALGLERLQIINDFTAQALAQADPSAHGNMLLIDGMSAAQAPLLVIGPGTGLGVSALVPAGGDYLPLEGEGGHVCLSLQSDAEMTLFDALRREVPHVSAEHFISGGGLETIYRLQNDGATMSAPDIGAAAIVGPGADNCRRADIRRRHCGAVILQPVNGLKAATTYKMLGRYMRYLAPQRVKQGHFSIALQGQADMPALAFQRQIVTTCRHQRRNAEPGARTNDQ